jgi:hypothetical protein
MRAGVISIFDLFFDNIMHNVEEMQKKLWLSGLYRLYTDADKKRTGACE